MATIIENLRSKMRRQTDYENALLAIDVIRELSMHFSTDDPIAVLDRSRQELQNWVTHYDPTPDIAEVK